MGDFLSGYFNWSELYKLHELCILYSSTQEAGMKRFSQSVVAKNCREVCQEARKEPVIIFHRDLDDDLVLISKKQYDELKEGK